MSKADEKGVYQLENGYWGFRYAMKVDGKKISQRKAIDENGNRFRTKNQALKARQLAMAAARIGRERQREIHRRTVAEIYEEYVATGRTGKAYQTIRKQDSLWNNHIKERFGNRFPEDISVAEINDYLADLYYNVGRSYRYVEGFLKIFYLIFGQAYSRNYMDVDSYNKICRNKDTKIHMPKLKGDDDLDIVTFSKEEIEVLDQYFEGTNAETAYLLGRMCGLRINEAFGLKWNHVDLKEGTIYIDRQMQYHEHLIKLVPVKTRNGRRTVYLNDKVKQHLIEKKRQREADEEKYGALRIQKRRLLQDLDGSSIYSTDMVNCLWDGTIQTVNSMKYPTREIKALGIDFKYHYLRHTYGTMMADLNTPPHILCDQMGHGKITVTQEYYLGKSKKGIDILRENINQL